MSKSVVLSYFLSVLVSLLGLSAFLEGFVEETKALLGRHVHAIQERHQEAVEILAVVQTALILAQGRKDEEVLAIVHPRDGQGASPAKLDSRSEFEKLEANMLASLLTHLKSD